MLELMLALLVADKPQDPTPPLPYEVREVEIASVDDVTLAGTLTVPEGEGPWPVAVLLTGSGPQDRDEALFGHRPFLVLADNLTRQGIAVLRYDDRGFGASTGDFAAATNLDFAKDADAAARFADDLPELDAVGFIGHSEGGLVGPMAAAIEDSPADFVVMLAGPGINGVETLATQLFAIRTALGIPEQQAQRESELNRDVLQSVADEADVETVREKMTTLVRVQFSLPEDGPLEEAQQADVDATVEQAMAGVSSEWFRQFLVTDPSEFLGQLDVPVLALFAEKDMQVVVEPNLPAVEAALDDAPTDDVTVVTLPGLSHFFHEVGGTPAAAFMYENAEQTMAPAVWETIGPWIGARFGNDDAE
ncbi:MAG: alpha/beta fold hydrolase [Planctomycetota bacterium]